MNSDLIGIGATTLFGLVSLWYAVKSNRDRARLEGNIQSTIKAVSDSLTIIGKRADYAKHHFDGIIKESHQLPKSENKNAVIKYGLVMVAGILQLSWTHTA